MFLVLCLLETYLRFLKYKLEAKELNDSTIKFPWRLHLRFQDGVF